MLSTLVADVQVRTPSLKRDEGLETVEYALIAALIAVVAIGVITTLGTGVRDTFQSIVDAIGAAPAGG
jgi:pilus assembly protein Flp/PilA